MKYLILGAGPAGLSLANALLKAGESSFVVLEANDKAGGLCRSEMVDGYPLDIGGGHFLDVKREGVNSFLFDFLPKDEWKGFVRDSQIYVHDKYIGHPFEANIWQLDIEEQIKYLKSIAVAGCNLNEPKPPEFVKWIYWKLGKEIAENYMLPYNQKMFGQELNDLGTYWMEKLPNVSFEDTLRSCIEKKAYGQQPAHAQFYYPKKYGYGELWLRMSVALGNRIEYNKKVVKMDTNNMSVRTEDGEIYKADCIITTIPWTQFTVIDGMPDDIFKSIGNLRHTSIQVDYYPETLNTNAQWIYYPDPKVTYHRILVRHNFCAGKGYWTETNVDNATDKSSSKNYTYVNEYAYPLNTIEKPIIMKKLLAWCEQKHIYGLGRWGEHQHYNSDLTVDLALKLSERLICTQ